MYTGLFPNVPGAGYVRHNYIKMVCLWFLILGIALMPQELQEITIRGMLFINRATLNLQESPFLQMNPSYHISVWVEHNGNQYLLCNLNKSKCFVNLKVAFGNGDTIKLYCKGLGMVQLTGVFEQTDPVLPAPFELPASPASDQDEESESTEGGHDSTEITSVTAEQVQNRKM